MTASIKTVILKMSGPTGSSPSESHGEGFVDPKFEVDAPKFYDFAAEGQNASMSSEGDSWFERKAEEIETEYQPEFRTPTALILEGLELEDPASKPSEKCESNSKENEKAADKNLELPEMVLTTAEVTSSSVNTEGEENLTAEQSAKPVEVEICSSQNKQEDLTVEAPVQGKATVDAPVSSSIDSKTNVTVSVISVEVGTAEGPSADGLSGKGQTSLRKQRKSAETEEPRRGRDRTKKWTAGSGESRPRGAVTTKPPVDNTRPEKEKAQDKKPLRPKKPEVSGSVKAGPVVASHNMAALDLPHKTTHAHPFRFATDKRIERRSASVPRHTGCSQGDKEIGRSETGGSKWAGFEGCLRNYAPSPAAPHRHATVPKPFHFHDSRKRSSSNDRSGTKHPGETNGSCSPKKRACKPSSGTLGVYRPAAKIRPTTQPKSPDFATGKRIQVRREHSVDRQQKPENSNAREQNTAENRGRQLPKKKSLDPGLFKIRKNNESGKHEAVRVPGPPDYTGPTLRLRLNRPAGGGSLKVPTGHNRTEENILKQKQEAQKALEEETKKLRLQAVFKAQPVKKYAAIEINHEVKVTSAVSPVFHTRSREHKANDK